MATIYILNFSHKVDGKRVPLVIDGIEYTMEVEASDKTAAIYKPEVKAFCDGRTDDTRVRWVSASTQPINPNQPPQNKSYTLTFSKDRVPFIIDGVEAQLRVEAANKTSAIFHPDTVAFCDLHICTVRSVA